MAQTFVRLLATLTSALLLAVLVRPGTAQERSAKSLSPYPGWEHSGSLPILTTREGADIPGTAAEEGFPLLVRLEKDWFDFRAAKAHGEDIRFASSAGTPLAYQVDQWDAGRGTARIWVRIPAIKGNARQEIKMFWGKADAQSQSSGSAVFNESNGYASVFHMDDPVQDEVGVVAAKDQGTEHSFGMIGGARHFSGPLGVTGGTNITTYPAGNGPHSTELWVRADKIGGWLLGWGVSKPNSVVQMNLARPPHIRLDCFYSLAGIQGESVLPLSQWTHVIHTYQPGESRLYVNGRLDGIRTGKNVSLTIGSPANLMRIGGGGFIGDMDEVRISKVARSADWVKLQYENCKPLQTAVGTLPWPGSNFLVSETKVILQEGKSVTLTAKAGGAQKVYWIIKSGASETVADVDRLSFTLHAGRVTGNRSLTLRFKAIYADSAKTFDIPVTIQEDIPEPVFTLRGPASWDGRATIEVVPQIANLDAMRAKGAGDLKLDWTVSGIAVIKGSAPGKLVLKRAQNSGTMTVTATVANGGEPVARALQITVKEPAKDSWIQRTPDKDEKPVDNQFFARDDNHEGTLYCNGTLSEPADSVFLKLYADEKLVKTERQPPKADKSYALSVRFKAGLIKYRMEFGTVSGGAERVLHTAKNLVCGDAYLINGQSNAVAYNYHKINRPDFFDTTSDWIRSYGTHGECGPDSYANGGWGNAVATNLILNGRGGVRFVGCWGMTLARKLVAEQKMPICILQGAVGGTRIDQHLCNEANREDTKTIYGRLLRRVKEARLTHGIRGVLWHQGEADQGFDGPDNCYGSETYQQYFVDLSAAWKQDYPNLQHYYLFQIWPNACGQGGTRHGDKLRDVERRLSRLYSNLSVMSTVGLPSGRSCHFDLADYEKMGLAMAALVERDDHGRVFAKPITAPDLQRAYFASDKNDEIVLEFDQPMAWNEALTGQFHLDGQNGKIASGTATGNLVKLKLVSASDAKTITWLVGKNWDHKAVLYGQNGIAALTFCDVPIAAHVDRMQ